MKKIFKRYLLVFSIGGAIMFSSCQKYLDVNVDPNNPSSADEKLLLPAAEFAVGIGLGDRYNNITNIWAQYWVGGPGVSQTAWDRHELQAQTLDRPWSSFYSSAGKDLATLIKSPKPVYRGIAKILTAYNFQLLVDLHGDVPFSEAFKGAIEDGGNIAPKFDSQTDIYDAIIGLINSGQADILGADQTLDEFPFAQDLIYGDNFWDIYGYSADGHENDPDLYNIQYGWNTFGNSLKLKIWLRQANAPGRSAAAQDSVAALFDNGAAFADWETQINGFSGASGASNSNPLFANFENSLKNFYVGTTTTIDLLLERGDPRIDNFYTPASTGDDEGLHVGIDPGSAGQPGVPLSKSEVSTIGSSVYSGSAPVILLNWSESLFLQAEAAARGWAVEDDERLFADAIEAAFIENGYDVDGLEYAGLYYDITDESSKLKSIAIEKWISMNGRQPTEAWIECRRFDTPSQTIFRGTGGLFKTPTSNVLGANIFPSMFVYPQNELNLNGNAPTPTVVTGKVFWDN